MGELWGGDRQTDTHINTMTRPCLMAGPSKQNYEETQDIPGEIVRKHLLRVPLEALHRTLKASQVMHHVVHVALSEGKVHHGPLN